MLFIPFPYYIESKNHIVLKQQLYNKDGELLEFLLIAANNSLRFDEILNETIKKDDTLSFHRIYAVFMDNNKIRKLNENVLNLLVSHIDIFTKRYNYKTESLVSCPQRTELLVKEPLQEIIKNSTSLIVHYFYYEINKDIYLNLFPCSSHYIEKFIDFKNRHLIIEKHANVFMNEIYLYENLNQIENVTTYYYFNNDEYILNDHYVIFECNTYVFWIKTVKPILILQQQPVQQQYSIIQPELVNDNILNDIRLIFNRYQFFILNITENGIYSKDESGNIMFIGRISDKILND